MAINRTADAFLLDAYTGLGGYASGDYLLKFPRESTAKYQYRKDSAVYPNLVGKIVDVYSGFLWRQTPSREAGDGYAAFTADADGLGHSLDYLLSSYQLLAMLLGTVYVIVDKSPAPAATRADEAMPYLTLRTPGQLVRGTIDAVGNLTQITFSESAGGTLVGVGSGTAAIGKTQYRTYTKDGWAIHEDIDGQGIVAQGAHALGRIPVVPLHSAKPLLPTHLRAKGWAYDIAQLNYDLYQQRSRITSIFADQAFSILALPARDQTERERLTSLNLGTGNGLTYDPEGGGKPDFLAPPDGPAKTQMEWYAKTIEDIYRQANLEFVGGVQQSGVALSFHFQEANSALTGMADLCEQAERDIAQLVHAWQGQAFDGHIAYPKDFNLTDLAQALAQAMDAVNLGLGPEFDKALKKRLAHQMLGSDTAPSVLAAIDREIDAQGDVYGDRAAQMAQGSAPPGGGP